jgi:hypothetical protein
MAKRQPSLPPSKTAGITSDRSVPEMSFWNYFRNEFDDVFFLIYCVAKTVKNFLFKLSKFFYFHFLCSLAPYQSYPVNNNPFYNNKSFHNIPKKTVTNISKLTKQLPNNGTIHSPHIDIYPVTKYTLFFYFSLFFYFFHFAHFPQKNKR